MGTLFLFLLGFVLLLAGWLMRQEPEVYATRYPRHLDPRICHAPWCMWTPQHPEDCDCADWRHA